MTHAAQLNVGRFGHSTDDPHMSAFMDNLDRVNAVAERSDGFVWRLKDESNNATAIRPAGDPTTAVNLTVWESVEALERFVWATVHKQFYNRKAEWFERQDKPHFVIWWVPAGHRPTIGEAKARLEYLTTHGPSEHAFGWESVPAAQLWKTARCGAPDGQAA